MSAALIREVKTAKGTLEYDADMEIGYLEGLFSAADSVDLSIIRENLAHIVVSWSFDGDPTDPEDWRKLRRSEFNAILKGVMEDLGDLGEE